MSQTPGSIAGSVGEDADERNWLKPTPILELPAPPAYTPHVSPLLLHLCWCLQYEAAKVRWHLAHPDRPVPGFLGPVAMPHRVRAKSPRQRAQLEERVVRLTREHVRRVVVTYWPRLAFLADAIGELAKEQTRGHEHRTLVQPGRPATPAPAPGA